MLVTTAADFDNLAMLEPDGGRLLRLDLGARSTDEIEQALRSVAKDLLERLLAARHLRVSGPEGSAG